MKSIIHKYITNEASKEELNKLEDACRNDVELRKEIAIYKTLNNRIINMNNNIDVDKAWENMKQRIIDDENKNNNHDKLLIYKWVAMALLIIGIGSIFYTQTTQNKIETTQHRLESSIKLPDGSEVYLNYQSSINYPDKFRNDKRVVSVSGEAYFNVKHNTKKPFIIKLKSSQIEVLGTSFNVKYRKGICSVFVTSGEVKLTSKHNKKSVHILPDEIGIINKNNISVIKNTNKNLLAWKSNSFQFKDTPLKTAFKSIEDAYNIKIETNSKQIANKRVTTIFNNVNDKNIVEIICKTFNLSYTHSGNRYYVYTKE